jgi:hypothetical protein
VTDITYSPVISRDRLAGVAGYDETRNS